MKKNLLLCLTALVMHFCSIAQCSGGYRKCSINWDYLSFLPSAGLSPYSDLARSQSQKFAFGNQRFTLTHNFTGSNALAENGTNTAETGSFGVGDDVQFIGDGAINIAFQNAVDSVKFSVYDVDYNQRITIVSNAGTVVSIAKISGSVITLVNSVTNTASATAAATTAVANNSTDGTINILITGNVTGFSITASQTGTKTNGPSSGQEDGSFWFSDLAACSPGSFTSNYFEVAKPYTNQGSYVLVSKDNQVYYTDVNTGKAKLVFTAPMGSNDINAMAYDPVNHYVYYVQDNPTALASNKTLYRYHYDMDTIGIAIADISTLLPTFDMGVESGGAAFYDGSLYFGIDIGSSSSYKCIIWRIDFDNANNPVAASQVFGIDAGGHDWGDFAVVKGMLFNFDGQASAENYHHQDLYSKVVTVYAPTTANRPKQTSVDWNGNVYSVGDYTATSPYRGAVTRYNEDGTLNTTSLQLANYNGVQITGQWRDGAEAFKPKVDFGDALASFDPIAGDPAMHEITPFLRLGSSSSNEWITRGQTAAANSDNFDDGMVAASLVNPSNGSFFAQIDYLNNTGAPATICAWIDFNNNGIFDAGEGQVQTNLPSSASTQTVFFNWTGMATTLTNGQFTYVRFRITSMANAMGISNPTGFYDEGEVEDYRVAVSAFPLETNLVFFNAVKTVEGKASISWKVLNEKQGAVYTVQRSVDSRNWKDVDIRQALSKNLSNQYSAIDPTIFKGAAYYRLKIAESGNEIYSDIRKLVNERTAGIAVHPNPASTMATINFSATGSGTANLHLYDVAGRKVVSQIIKVAPGINQQSLDVSLLQNGLYFIRMENAVEVSVYKLHIEK